MTRKRIVITAAGVTSALGQTRQELFQNLLDGKSAIAIHTDWGDKMQSDKPVCAGSVHLPEETVKSISRHYRRSMGPSAMFAALAAKSAAQEAGLSKELLGGGRCGCIASATMGSPSETYDTAMSIIRGDLFEQSACQFFKIVSHSSSFNVANYLGINGVQLCPCSACASSLQSIGLAYEQLLLGKQDIFLAGGSDEAAPIVLESFMLLRALAENSDLPPEELSRPFDEKRSGLICGEGGGMLVIETLEHAEARGAKPLAEIIGYATNCTGSQISQSDHDSIIACMRLALQDASITPDEVDYISAHATSTIAGDREEALAIASLFGKRPPVSSLKGQLGHTLGASGALEIGVLLEMMRHGTFIPTANLTSPSEECRGINLFTAPLKLDARIILKNCIAFGGVNSTIILKAL